MDVVRTTQRRRLLWVWTGVFVIGAVVVAGLWGRGAGPEDRWRRIDEAIRAKRWSVAEAGLSRWVERSPDDGQAWLRLGGILGMRGRDEKALAALGRVRNTDPAWAVAQGSIGEIALRRHEAALAERALRASVSADPKAIEPKRRLVFLLMLEQRPEEARAVLWDLYRLDPQPRHLVTMTGLMGVEADGRDLNPELEKFLARSPQDPWLRRARGLTLLLQGRAAEALPHLEAAASELDGDPIGRLALAECRITLGHDPGPRETDEAWLGAEPQRPAERARWWVLRSRLEERRGRAAEALACLRRAVEANPDDRTARYRLGQALLQRGETKAARTHLDRAEAIRAVLADLKFALTLQFSGNVNAEAFEHLGHLCREAGLIPDARAWFEQSIRLDPVRSTAQTALVRLEPAREPSPLVPQLRAHALAPAGRKLARTPVAEPSGVSFQDVAERAGLGFQYDAGATGELFIADTMGGGVGLIDYDGDGWLDIYFVNGCQLPIDPASVPAPNKLFRNRGDGSFEDVTKRAGVAGAGYGMGCAVGDFDNDGHDDLFVTGLDRTILYRNRGDGTFEDATARAAVGSSRWTTAAGFGDLDGDGDLDLFVVTYVEADPRTAPPCRDHNGERMHCPPAYFPDQTDLLFRNNGDGTFTDVSREAGIELPKGPGLGLAIADLDGDGRLDLFVANDTAPNYLFRNLGHLRFEEVGVTAGVAYDGTGQATASMGVVADDLDGDGRIDLFHTNFLNEPDTLLRNLGGGLFEDATIRANIDAPGRTVTGWGAAAFDADNDGRLDLFVANGHLDQQPSLNRPMAQLQHLFRGQGKGRFVLCPPSTCDYFQRELVARGVAAGDLDNDGRIDLVVVHRDAPASVLRNTSTSGHWLEIRLRGTRSGRTPVGARATCEAGGQKWVHWLTTGTSYLSASDQRVNFGIGGASAVERLEVRWPSGALQSWTDVRADRLVEIVEGRRDITEMRPRGRADSASVGDSR